MAYTQPEGITKGINARFYKLLSETTSKPLTAQIIELLDTDQKAEEYLFAGNFWEISEWTTTPTWSNFYNKDYKYKITNKDWITGQVAIKKSDYRAEKANLGASAEMAIRSAVEKYVTFPDKLVADLVDANGNAFDGTAFFSDSRPNIEGTTAIDNLITGTGSTLSAIYTDMGNAINALLSLVDKGGTPFNISTKFIAMIPPSLFNIFNTLKNSDTLYISGTQSNNFKGIFDFIVNPYLGASDTDWYLINANAPVKPFIVQIEQKPVWDYADYKDDPFYKFFATCSMNAGYGNPMSIICVNNTGTGY